MSDGPEPKRTEQHIEVVSTGEHQNHVHVTANVEIGPRLQAVLVTCAKWLAIAAGLLAIAVALPGCVQPGAANVRVLDEQGVRVLVDSFTEKLDEWLPPPKPGDDSSPLALMVGGLVMYGGAELRKWIRDKNGKHKPETK